MKRKKKKWKLLNERKFALGRRENFVFKLWYLRSKRSKNIGIGVFKEYERNVKERIREKGNYADELEEVLKKHDKTEKNLKESI
jgi:hypothetical protein